MPFLSHPVCTWLLCMSRGQGELGPAEKLTANLTILASDDPYGVFVIADENRPIHTPSAFTGN